MSDELQKIGYASTRALCETYDVEREPVINYGAADDSLVELIVSYGADHFHFPSQERLGTGDASPVTSVITSGAQLIGVLDNFTTIAGNTDLQAVLESIDSFITTYSAWSVTDIQIADNTTQAFKMRVTGTTEYSLQVNTNNGSELVTIGGASVEYCLKLAGLTANADYTFSHITTTLALTCNKAATAGILQLATNDADGTDNCNFRIYGVGNSAATNTEFLWVGYVASGTTFDIYSQIAGSGTRRTLKLYNGVNSARALSFDGTSGYTHIGNGTAEQELIIDGAAGSSKNIYFESASSIRWRVQANSTTEGGSDAGCNFAIVPFDDSGVTKSTALFIERATGFVGINYTTISLPYRLTVSGTAGIIGATGGVLTLRSSKTSISTNDILGEIDFYAVDTQQTGIGAKIYCFAESNFAAGTAATSLVFCTNTGNIETLATALTINSALLATFAGAVTVNGNMTIGAGVAATDYTLTFDGETNNGVITWMEDEDYFTFSDDILMDGTERINFGTVVSYIYSPTSGYLTAASSSISILVGTSASITMTGASPVNIALSATNLTLSIPTSADGAFFIKKADSTELFEFDNNAGIGIWSNTRHWFILQNDNSDAFRIYDTSSTIVYFRIATTDTGPLIILGNTTNNPTLTLAGTGLTTLGGGLTVTGVLDVDGTGDSYIGGDLNIEGDELAFTSGGANTITSTEQLTIISHSPIIIQCHDADDDLTLQTASSGDIILAPGRNLLINSGTFSIGTATFLCRQVTDAGPMTATPGTEGEIVYNLSNDKWYGCTASHPTAATWSALN